MTLAWTETGADVLDPCYKFRLDQIRAALGEEAYQGAWFTVLIEMAEQKSLNDLKTLADERWKGDSEAAQLIVPDVYSATLRAMRGTRRFFTLYARSEFLEEINRAKGGKAAEREAFGVGRALLGSAIPEAFFVAAAPPPDDDHEPDPVPEGTVVMAVIDNGIAFGHDLFRNGADSLVNYAWVMDAVPPPASPLQRGRKFSQPVINAALAARTSAGLLDEDGFYRDLEVIDFAYPGFRPTAMRVSHGTHVMGLAAGVRPGENDQERPIICVDLPTTLTSDTSGAELAPDLNLAIDWILDRADKFRIDGAGNRRPPLVVNFSYGDFAGPHDGTGLIEDMIDAKLKPVGQDVTRAHLPAGNGNLARCHAEIDFAEDDVATLDWRILPDDRTASFVELWMPFRQSLGQVNFVNVTVTTPEGQTSGVVGGALDDGWALTRDGVEIARVEYRFIPHPTRRAMICLSVARTAGEGDAAGLAPAGLWRIRVAKGEDMPAGKAVHVWIRRDETLPGFPPFGRQSFFDNACYERFDEFGAPLSRDPKAGERGSDCIVRRAGTLSGFATAKEPSVIAGFVRRERILADYSAAGPITPTRGDAAPGRPGPDATAVSDDSLVLAGVLSAGSRSGSIVAMNGTSVAAPQTARWVAGELSDARPGGRAEVKHKGENDDHLFRPPAKYPEPRAGGGRMKLCFRIGPDR